MALNKLRKITPKNISRHIRKIVGLDIPFETWKANSRGFKTAPHWQAAGGSTSLPQSNALRDFFVNHKEGPGIWKWEHYFDVYDRHFHRFRGQQINILEIGIYSGGSLDMWRHYFGPKAHIYGVDIEPACRIYESDAVTVFIGDQGDRQFWDMFRRNVPYLDIVVDDGSHHPDDQIVSAEELLPFLRPGGVYLCEDVHGAFNRFASYVHGLDHGLNDDSSKRDLLDGEERGLLCECTPLQSALHSIHLYPFITVIEKNQSKVAQLRAPKHGTQWQPFLKREH